MMIQQPAYRQSRALLQEIFELPPTVRAAVFTLLGLAGVALLLFVAASLEREQPPVAFPRGDYALVTPICPGDSFAWETELVAAVADDLLGYRSIRRPNADGRGAVTYWLSPVSFFPVEAGDVAIYRSVQTIPDAPSYPDMAWEPGPYYLLVSVSHVGLRGAPARYQVRFDIAEDCP